MPFRLPSIYSRKAGVCFLAAGCLIGLSIGFSNLLAGGPTNALWGYPLACGTMAVVLWMMILVSHYDDVRLKRRNRLIRKALGKPSPWGERRVEAANPYEDRLASFLVRSVAPLESKSVGFEVDPPEGKNSRRFWSLRDLPQDSVEPKPQSYIRRLLYRIRLAIRGE